MVGYAVVLVPVLAWGQLDGSSPPRFGWALLPVVPALWMVRAVLRHLDRADQGALADQLAVSRQTVNAIETGR